MSDVVLDIIVETDGVPDATEALLRRVAGAACRIEGVEGVGAALRIVDDAAIWQLNHEARSVDRPTDVLSFPTVNYRGRTARDSASLIRREYDPDLGACFLGDIVLSIDRARAQAEEYGHSLEREMGFLTAHAMLHLFGYDHETDSDRAAMREMEERIMADVNLPRA